MRKFQEKLRDGKPALGTMITGGPQLIDYIAQAGFDFVIPDLMLTGIDWDTLAYMTRACHAENMGCLPRLQSFPFAGSGDDNRLVVDAARALALRVDGVSMSVRSVGEVRQVVGLHGDWHRGVAPTSAEQVQSLEVRSRQQTLIMASIESKSSIAQADEIIDVENLSGIFIAWHDFTKSIGYPLQIEHPEVLKVAERIVKRARSRGLIVLANTGFLFPDIESNAQRVKRMAEMGIQLIMVQLAEWIVRSTLAQIGARVEELGARVADAP